MCHFILDHNSGVYWWIFTQRNYKAYNFTLYVSAVTILAEADETKNTLFYYSTARMSLWAKWSLLFSLQVFSSCLEM